MLIIITGNNNNNSNNNKTPLMEIKNNKNMLPVGSSGEIDTEKYESCGLHYLYWIFICNILFGWMVEF